MDRYGSGIKWGHHGHPKLAVFRTGWAWISHLTLERWVILCTNPGFIKAAWFVQLVQAKNVVNDGTSSPILCSPCMCISVLRKWFFLHFITFYKLGIFHDIPCITGLEMARIHGFAQPLQSNDKLMPNSCLGQNLLVKHHGIAVSRNSCLSHAQILKHHGIAYVQEECFHTWENQMFAKIRLQLHSTVHVSGVEKYDVPNDVRTT